LNFRDGLALYFSVNWQAHLLEVEFMISLSDEVAVLRIIASLQEMVDADTVWTRFLKSASKIGNPDRKALLELSKRMDKLLTGVPSAMLTVQRVAQKAAKKTGGDQEFLRSLPEAERKQVEAWVGEADGFAGALRGYVGAVRKSVASERKLLAEKRKLVTSGKFTKGDLSQGFICDIAKVVIILAILTGNETAYRWGYAQAHQENC
jgi:hypothetical protein